jgi:hypothetical protein
MKTGRSDRDRHRCGDGFLQVALAELCFDQSRGRDRSGTPHAGPQKNQTSMSVSLSTTAATVGSILAPIKAFTS